ncbi:GNAT family N-acetyltransferase [Qingshengfaniella alkalisoli]|nr:GNAT family N-acetyltransferase [Qingshengfaniella alkalisoli]
MTLPELVRVLGWARQEGWNPGLDDGEAFFAADPEGYFLAEIEGKAAAAISVVNHDQEHAFLGLYICLPEFRGQGVGHALWRYALSHAGSRSVGLDGVPAQQANYEKSGFNRAGRTIRYKGNRMAALAEDRLAEDADLPRLIEADRRMVGYDRQRFLTSWFRPCGSRQTVVLGTYSYATFRRCHEGIKIGPLHAPSGEEAMALLARCPKSLGDGPLYIDVPDRSPLERLVRSLGYAPVFETARMVKGARPTAKPPAYYSVATLELG